MEMASATFRHVDGMFLESGKKLCPLEVRWCSAGKGPIVWVCPPFTASPNVFQWWSELFGPGKFFDPSRYTIVCPAMIGSSYGSSGPLSEMVEGGSRFYAEFPRITMRDIVGASEMLRRYMMIERVHALIGPSMGGKQALEWAVTAPEVFDHLILIGCNASQSPYNVALNEAQRMAIEADPTWTASTDVAGQAGLMAARAFAVATYRTHAIYQATQGGLNEDGVFRAAAYQRHIGKELSSRFCAVSYLRLSEAADSHDVAHGRGSLSFALSRVTSKCAVVSLEADLGYPETEMRAWSSQIRNSRHYHIQTIYGHDGFLKERAALEAIFVSELGGAGDA